MKNKLDSSLLTEIAAWVAPDRHYRQRRLTAILWLLAIMLGAIQALDFSETPVAPDTISYLDIGDAYFKGNWGMAISSQWPPLNSWLLGLAMHVLKPSPLWEFSVVRLVNFVAYLFALVCFHFFLLELIRYHQRRTDRVSGARGVTRPEWVWLVLGYTLFIWSSLSLITIHLDASADMCVAALVYLASGLLLRIRMGFANWLTFALLGAVLGFSYLAKTSMFFLAFIFLGVSAFSSGNLRRAVPGVLLALITFLAVGGPFIVAMSMAKGRLTFGDSGALNYSFHVNGIPDANWQGDPPGNGIPIHPTRKIFDNPVIYEFGTPIGGTYPPWYDAVYWNEGAVPHFDLNGQIRVLVESATTYINVFFFLGGGLVVGWFVLYFMGYSGWSCVKDIAEYWSLLIPAIVALGLFSLVHVEPRYTGPFVVLLWLAIFSGVRLPDSQESMRLVAGVTVAMLIVMMIGSGFSPVMNASVTIRDLIRGKFHPWPYEQWQVADGLRQMGVQPGDKVAFIGYAFLDYWARLARVRIAAQLPSDNSYWAMDSSVKAQINKAFTGTGAVVVVTRNVPSSVSMSWQRIGTTHYYALILPR